MCDRERSIARRRLASAHSVNDTSDVRETVECAEAKESKSAQSPNKTNGALDTTEMIRGGSVAQREWEQHCADPDKAERPQHEDGFDPRMA